LIESPPTIISSVNPLVFIFFDGEVTVTWDTGLILALVGEVGLAADVALE
jgi:hypothetical protein